MHMAQFDNYVVCRHPFNEHIPKKMNTLIVGTFPTHEKNYKDTFPFYYGGSGNMFWPTLEKVYQKSFEHKKGIQARDERENFLTYKNIGITDLLEKCYRKNDRSQDKYIFPITFRNIFNHIEQTPSLKTIILTSRTKIIGALGLFETLCHHYDIEPPKLQKAVDNILEGWLSYKGRDIEVLVPYSTSKTVIEEETATPLQLVKMYTRCLT
jgi:G:T/U-mismatch repair DNA glycosylase